MITSQLRDTLGQPLGRLIRDGVVTRALLEPYFAHRLAICVGDRTTERMQEFGLDPNLEIVDSVERRTKRDLPKWYGDKKRVLQAENPPGTISSDSLERLAEILDVLEEKKRAHLRLEITGEEDLLALPILAFYPDDTIVFYGQPKEGLVVVSSSDARGKSRVFLRRIGITKL